MAEPVLTPEHLANPEQPQIPVGKVPTRAERVRAAMGKYAWIPFSSDDHVREKRAELELDERDQGER
jgi:hypothetical protein